MSITAISDIPARDQHKGSIYTSEGYNHVLKCEQSGEMWMVKMVEKSASGKGYPGVCAWVGFLHKLSVKKFCEYCNTEGKTEQQH